MRTLLLLIPLLAGCAHPQVHQDAPAAFNSPGIERCLRYWTAHFSRQATNHFYVYPTDLDQGELVGALVYWREGGRLLDYAEMPEGEEAQAWRLRPKVDSTAVLTDEQISGGNDLVAHRVWIGRVRRCISRGREYVVTLAEAMESYPTSKQPSQATGDSPAPTEFPSPP